MVCPIFLSSRKGSRTFRKESRPGEIAVMQTKPRKVGSAKSCCIASGMPPGSWISIRRTARIRRPPRNFRERITALTLPAPISRPRIFSGITPLSRTGV